MPTQKQAFAYLANPVSLCRQPANKVRLDSGSPGGRVGVGGFTAVILRALWFLVGVSSLFPAPIGWGACSDYPATYDLERLEYSLEKIGASLRLVLDFPKLAAHPSCRSRTVQWGTLWELELDKTDPVLVKVYDRNHTLVQEFGIYGPMDLKVTANAASFRFFRSLTTKRVGDHRLVSVELWNAAPLFPLPSLDIDDSGTRRQVSGAFNSRRP